MTLDQEDHRKFLLDLINAVSIPGTLLELAIDVKWAIQAAEVAPKPPEAT